MTSEAQRSRLTSASFRAALGGYRAEARYEETMRTAPADDPLSRAQ